MCSIGIDIGGMSVKAGLVDKNGKILLKSVDKTASTPNLVANNMLKQINRILRKVWI